MDQFGEKTQEATPHRRQKAREEGHVALSHDLVSAALLVAGVGFLLYAGRGIVEFFGRLTMAHLGGEAWRRADVEFCHGLAVSTLEALAGVLWPVLLLMVVLAVALNLAQAGLLFLPQKVTPDWSRIDPLGGLRRMFSVSNLTRLGFGILKIAIVGGVAYASLVAEQDRVLALATLELPQIAASLVEIVLWTALKVAGALLLLAILDYAFQRWKLERDLRMTTQEIREELKSLEGDPQISARRRAVQRQLILNRLKTAVPKADVVITNPTELAIAIQYDAETMQAPIVVAKGAGVLAERIRTLAAEHGIPIIEKKPLAQALYKQVDVNRPVPPEWYAAVAEVLAYVYQLKGKPMPTAAGSAS